MPSLWRKYETLIQASQAMKSDLGFPGYQRVPRVLDIRFMPPPETGRTWEQLTDMIGVSRKRSSNRHPG